MKRSYEQKLKLSVWSKHWKVGRIVVRRSDFPLQTVKEYLTYILIGVGFLLLSPLALIYLLYTMRPKFFWFRGSNEEWSELIKQRDEKRVRDETITRN